MKKCLCFLIIVCLTWGILVPVNAETKVFDEPYKILSTTEDTMTIQFYGDNVTYDFIRGKNEITVVDHASGEIVFVSEVTYYEALNKNIVFQNQSCTRAVAGEYENWNTAWSEYRRGHIQLPSPEADTFISITAGLLLSGCGILGVAASTVIAIAAGYRDRSLNNAYFIQYYRTNLDCGILAKTYSKYFTSSSYSVSLGSSPTGHMWTDTPWDYSNPAPCRVLVNTYPV